MSLTSELGFRGSRIVDLLGNQAPHTQPLTYRAGKELQSRPLLRREGNLWRQMIGTALDYRLRLYYPYAWGPVEETIAFLGAEVACGVGHRPAVMRERRRRGGGVLHINENVLRASESGGYERLLPPEQCLSVRLMANFLVRFDGIVRRLQPANRRLNFDDETLLCRYCVVLALLEYFFRLEFRANLRSRLIDPRPLEEIFDLLDVATTEEIADLTELSWAFFDTQSPLLTRPAILNPKFSGGRFIGGADADLIVDRCLIDIKTAVKPVSRRSLWQLLAYVLLDDRDRYQIESVGLYCARHACLLTWPVDELIHVLSRGQMKDRFRLRKMLFERYPVRIRPVSTRERMR